MHTGEIIIAAIAAASLLAWGCFIVGAEGDVSEDAWGDWPLLPEGLRGPARKAGERPGNEPAQVRTVISHHDGGVR